MQNMLRHDRIPNGLLLWGAEGVGKRTAALEFAKAVNCTEGEFDACGSCLSCRKVDSGNHPDLKIVAPVKKSRNIDVETIESVNELASLSPYEGDWRVFIFLDAERMRPPAQNHLLKTLEEPPGRSVFLLISAFPRMLLPTIRSRCQMVRFQALQPTTVVDLLARDRDLPDETAHAIARLSQGQMARALDLVDSEKREVTLGVAQQLAKGDDPSALADDFAKLLQAHRKQIETRIEVEMTPEDKGALPKEVRDHMSEERLAVADAMARRDILEYLYLFETWYRDELVFAATGNSASVLNRDCVSQLEANVSTDPSAKIAAIERARLFLDRFINEERVFRQLFFVLAEK
jgi:DNA polymerase-3 subunit delta'